MSSLETKASLYPDLFSKIKRATYSAVRNPYVIAAGIIGLAALLPEAVHAAQSTLRASKEYGFWDGALDGILLPANLVMDLLGDGGTWAQDGNGIISEPNTTTYWMGYFATAGSDGLIVNVLGGSRGDK